ncbi:serine threonine- kinase Nek11-like [Brachionus plicatilis]|uniref:non-specific serine/threonine protein kinase n=1 Tax=Brachionus plicatilis TaxID=10195 RepID=A0A3M7QLJ1_BRAPC|nr:serine threonine- kinase Nek11-like [Brachionus plicatilis]
MSYKYRFEKELNRGGFGVAYLVSDLKEKKSSKVIKKIALRDVRPEDAIDVAREADLLSKIEHDHVLVFHESYFEDHHFCIVTEYCDGGDLKDFLSSRNKDGCILAEELVIELTIQLLSALVYIHSMGIIHRDLKTRNVFLKKTKHDEHSIHLVIGDFGISKVIPETSTYIRTGSHCLKGTTSYTSPERFSGKYDFKSDIWSLGCIVFEMCTFKLAYSGKTEPEIIYKIVYHNQPNLPNSYSIELKKMFKK